MLAVRLLVLLTGPITGKTALSLVQFSHSVVSVWLFEIPWMAICQVSLSITNSKSLLKFMSIESVMPSISSSVIPFSSCLQSFPAAGSFPMSQFFTSGGQSIRASVPASVLPMNIEPINLPLQKSCASIIVQNFFSQERRVEYTLLMNTRK